MSQPSSRVWRLMVIGALAPVVLAGAGEPPMPVRAQKIALTAPEPNQEGTISGAFDGFGYGDLTARTRTGTLSYFFPIPAGTIPTDGGQVTFNVRHSALLVPDRSTMTVVINGQSLESVALTKETTAETELSIDLPTGGFIGVAGEGYFMQVRFLMRLTRDECEDPDNPALWATVSRSSAISIPLIPAEANLSLTDLPAILTTTRLTTNPDDDVEESPAPITIVAAGTDSPLLTRAAATVAFAVGRWSGSVNQDPQPRFATEIPEHGPVIVLATGADLAPNTTWGDLTWDGNSFATSAGTLDDGLGIVAAMGRWTANAESIPSLVFAADLDESDRDDHHLVLIGDATANSLTAAVLAATDNTSPVATPLAFDAVERSRADLRLMTSPFNDAAAVLIISAADDEGRAIAAVNLGQRSTMERLRGQTVTLTGTLNPQTLVNGESDQTLANLAPQVIVQEPSVIERLAIWQVIGAILLGAIVATFLMIIVIRWMPRSRT